MAAFFGTNLSDEILFDFLSGGVTTDPSGLQGTGADINNVIYGYGGDDHIETGEGDTEAHGGNGDDTITGGALSTGLDWLYGDAGADIIDAQDGALDIVDGGSGADQMYGGEGQHIYIVDNYGDIVSDSGLPASMGGTADGIVSTISYRLSEGSTVEDLFLAAGAYAPELRTALVAIGNSGDNTVTGNRFNNILAGRDGSDWLSGAAGDDLVLGGAGDDQPLQGGDGNDTVRGQDGADIIWGGNGTDKLIGGRGNDIFAYDHASEFNPLCPDTIRPGDEAVAFQGVGAASGDLIRLPRGLGIDADGRFIPFDFDVYVFGGTGKGHVSVVDDPRGNSLVRVNIDDDFDFELTIRIADAATRACAYTSDDFLLSF